MPGQKSNSTDVGAVNAAMENFVGAIEGLTNFDPNAIIEVVITAVDERLHSSLSYTSPTVFECRFYETNPVH